MKTVTVEQGVSLSLRGNWLPPDSTPQVLLEVALERRNQHEAWGEQNWENGTGPEEDTEFTIENLEGLRWQNEYMFERGELTFSGIFLEEVMEVMTEADPDKLRAELIQVAAVAIQWVEAIDRKRRAS